MSELFGPDGLIGGECATCGRRHFPHSIRCPWCGSDEVSTVTLSTTGTLWAWTAVNTAAPGYEGPVPYGFGVVELPEDRLRVITRLSEPDPSALRQGMAMRFTTVAVTAATTTWCFEPA